MILAVKWFFIFYDSVDESCNRFLMFSFGLDRNLLIINIILEFSRLPNSVSYVFVVKLGQYKSSSFLYETHLMNFNCTIWYIISDNLNFGMFWPLLLIKIMHWDLWFENLILVILVLYVNMLAVISRILPLLGFKFLKIDLKLFISWIY